MKHRTKLTSLEQQQEAALSGTAQAAVREFATVEEMLRHDAIHTPVPPAIVHRLMESVAQLPPPARSWWRRLTSSSNDIAG